MYFFLVILRYFTPYSYIRGRNVRGGLSPLLKPEITTLSRWWRVSEVGSGGAGKGEDITSLLSLPKKNSHFSFCPYCSKWEMFLFRNLELDGLKVPILQTRAILMTLANAAEVEAMNALLPILSLFLSSASPLFPLLLYFTLTHWGRVTQICVFTLQLCKTDDANLRF